jgi:hypothetical protein
MGTAQRIGALAALAPVDPGAAPASRIAAMVTRGWLESPAGRAGKLEIEKGVQFVTVRYKCGAIKSLL